MDATLASLLRLLPLDALPRQGWVQAGVPAPESVAAHSHGACLVALALGPRVEPPLDTDRAVSLLALHDVPEALTGDLPRAGARHLPEGAKRTMEAGAAAELLGPWPDLARERFAEATERATREARFAKACDRLHLGLRMLGYARAGQRGLDDFAATVAALDLDEFPPCARLRDALLAAYRETAR